MQNTDEIWRLVDAKRTDFEALADRVWETPELLYTEFKSSAEHLKMMEQQGFRISTDLAGIPTAIMGEAGEDGPVIAILGEYDALPGLSQEAGVAEHRPLVSGGNGHGCGHNLLGSASLLAATAVKDYLEANGLKGRVRYYGCPAEEGGAAKAFMVREGCFSDVDIAISWHPAAFPGVTEADSLANTRIDFTFIGRASHAAAGVASGPAVSMALRSASAAASMRAMMSPATPASPAPPSSASGSTSAAAAVQEEETRVIFKGRGAGSRAPGASRCSGPRRATLARPHPHTRTHPLAHPASRRLPGALRGASHALGARGAAWSLRVPRSAPGAT